MRPRTVAGQKTAPANGRGIAAAKRLGMTEEGVLRKARCHDGVLYDVMVLSVLAEEWPAA